MRVAISQPEHFPYLGFFQKMCACDLFVLLDDVQFSGPRSFQNRNRYLNKNGEYTWFTVPVANGSYFRMINEVEVAGDERWRVKLKARLYQDLKFDDFQRVYGYNKLVDINIASIKYCRESFGIEIPMIRSSALHVSGQKADRIYRICKELDADTYVAGLGSKEYMRFADFRDVEVQYFYPVIDNYESSIVYTHKNSGRVSKQMHDICASPELFYKGE